MLDFSLHKPTTERLFWVNLSPQANAREGRFAAPLRKYG
jgi:hypothetical protein